VTGEKSPPHYLRGAVGRPRLGEAECSTRYNFLPARDGSSVFAVRQPCEAASCSGTSVTFGKESEFLLSGG